MFQFTHLVFNCDGGVLGLFWFGILDFRFSDLGFWILGFWIFGFWILGFWSLGLLGDFGCLIFVILDFGIFDFRSQQKNGVTWQRSTMVLGPKACNGSCTISDLSGSTPRGLPFGTLSTWGYEFCTYLIKGKCFMVAGRPLRGAVVTSWHFAIEDHGSTWTPLWIFILISLGPCHPSNGKFNDLRFAFYKAL